MSWSEGFVAEKMRENRDKRAGWAREQAPGARAADWGRLVFKVLPISRSSRGFTSSLGLWDLLLAGVGSFS